MLIRFGGVPCRASLTRFVYGCFPAVIQPPCSLAETWVSTCEVAIGYDMHDETGDEELAHEWLRVANGDRLFSISIMNITRIAH